MIKSQKIVIKFYLFIIALSFVVLFAFLLVNEYVSLERDIKIHTAEVKDMIDNRLTLMLHELDIFPDSMRNDLLFVSELSSLEKFIKGEGVLEDVEHDFFSIIKNNAQYYQLRYIDENGDEIVRVEFDGKRYKKVPAKKLQNKKDMDYFADAMKLSEGEIYLSKLDLNMEHGEIENRGTKDNPRYVPVMRTGIPVFDESGNHKGIVLFNVYADYFLGEIRSASRDDEKLFLIDKDGVYLSHPDRKKEFSFRLGTSHNFYEDYAEASREILTSESDRIFESENFIFAHRDIFPTASAFIIHKGAEKLFGEDPERNYFWVLVSVSEKSELNNSHDAIKKDHFLFMIIVGVIILIIFFLLLFFVFEVFKHAGGER